MLRTMTAAEQRALARESWPSELTTLAAQAEPLGPFEPQAAWDAVLELSRQAFTLAGLAPTSRPRAEWPSKLFRPGEPRPDSNER